MKEKDQKVSDSLEAGVVAAVIGRTDVKVVSWQVVRSQGMQDPVYLRLLEGLGTGSWTSTDDFVRVCRSWTVL